ncbi:hypothetical protein KW785_02690 [Candidatus Parcubacteria bacterium]|nr:hypothetical protein [Candidatus Parcubacteria bacterium]
MSAILRPANLKVCLICGSHARIVFTDGSKSPAFGTKKRGLAYLEAARASGLVVEGEDQYAIDQILTTSFVFEDEHTDQITDELQRGLITEEEKMCASPELIELVRMLLNDFDYQPLNLAPSRRSMGFGQPAYYQ